MTYAQHTSVNQSEPSLYNAIPVMLYTIDLNDQVVDVNERWLQMLGYTRAEVIGRCSTDFYTAASRQLLQTVYMAQFFKQGQLEDVELQLVKKNGEIIDVLVSATAERNATGEIARALVVTFDISQRKHAEQMLRAISAGTAAVTGGDFFHSLVSHLAIAFQARHAMVTECTDHTMTRVRTLAYAVNHDFVENIEYDLAGTPCAGVIQGAVCYYPERLEELFPIEVGLESFLGMPICDSHGNTLGHLAVRDDKRLCADQSDIDVLKIFATRAGVELECRRAERALLDSERQLRQLNERLTDYNRSLEAMVTARTREIEQRRQVAESLRDMVMILNSERPLTEILDYIAATASRLLGTASSAIFTLLADQQTLAIQTARGLPADYTNNLHFPIDRSLLGQALLKRQPVVISNLASALLTREITLDAHRRALLSAHYQTLLAVPLIRQYAHGAPEEVYGGIGLYYPEQRHFSDEEIELAVAFGAQAALAIENARLRQQAEMGAIIEERARLARELHDSVTQSLYSLTLLAEGWRRMAKAGRLATMEDALAELGQLGQQALKEMRLLVYELHPPMLTQEGLLGALHQRLAMVEKRAGVETHLHVDEQIELPAPVEAGLYRIAQEALNNTLKHAAATVVTIHVHADDVTVTLEVTDNGQGFDQTAFQQGRGSSEGLGLTSMYERAAQIGGVLTIHSAPGAGTSVLVQIPQRRSAA